MERFNLGWSNNFGAFIVCYANDYNDAAEMYQHGDFELEDHE